MSSDSYWAHSAENSLPGSESRAGWQLLSVHLQAVSQLARALASAARPNDGNLASLAAISGGLHDFGKYSDCFQKMLRTGQGRCQHAIHGAMLAKFGTLAKPLKPGLQTVAAAITGHHAGLSDWNTGFRTKMLDTKYRNEASSRASWLTACK